MRAQLIGLRLHIRHECAGAVQHACQIEIRFRDARAVQHRQRRARRQRLLVQRCRIDPRRFAKLGDVRVAARGTRIVRCLLSFGCRLLARRERHRVIVRGEFGLVKQMRGGALGVDATRVDLGVVCERARHRQRLICHHHPFDVERQRIVMHRFAVIQRNAQHQVREEPQRVERQTHLFDIGRAASLDKAPRAQRRHLPFDGRMLRMHAGQAIRFAALQIAVELLIGRRALKQRARRTRRKARRFAYAPLPAVAARMADARLPVETERPEACGRVTNPMTRDGFVGLLEVRHRAVVRTEQRGEAIAVIAFTKRIAAMARTAERLRVAERHRHERLRFVDAQPRGIAPLPLAAHIERLAEARRGERHLHPLHRVPLRRVRAAGDEQLGTRFREHFVKRLWHARHPQRVDDGGPLLVLGQKTLDLRGERKKAERRHHETPFAAELIRACERTQRHRFDDFHRVLTGRSGSRRPA
ncbi:hypothetical protein LMG29542_07526 [Paraburkholderia humisilvae]|uniref:Uncharacterized protein n=1 Tax=Paraburkholderia humisilvae TaxID=627669 RepID=A0A6J5F9S6_9BURK|nr:hypothetical protein LMG29542_07526 [Paraburkholderia humisilvae]